MRIYLLFFSFMLILSCSSDSLPDIIYMKDEIWVKQFRNNSHPSKTLYKNKIYCSSIRIGQDNYLYALNLMTGKVDWATKVKDWATSPPIVNDSLIYYSSYLGDLYRLDLNGQIIWEQETNSTFKDLYINPFNGNLLVNTMTNGLMEFDVKNGGWVRNYADNSFSISSPLFLDNQLLISGVKYRCDTTSLLGDLLFSFNLLTGDTNYHYRIGKTRNIFYKNDRLFFYEEDSSVMVCLSLKDKVKIWNSPKIPNIISSNVFLTDSNVYCYGSNLNEFFELDIESGRIKRKVCYANLVEEGLIKPLNWDYSIVSSDKIWKIRVTDSLETPVPIGSELNVYVQ
jgi:outer membrane protein assembly factor BamB